MSREVSDGKGADGAGLGPYMRNLRKSAGKTLRQIEEESGVSNAYLSQIESGSVSRPSPNVLHSVAAAYGTTYENLMTKAGYLSKDSERTNAGQRTRSGALPTLERQKVTPEEEEALLEYLAFLRSRKSKG